jgi:hypothetical protein
MSTKRNRLITREEIQVKEITSGKLTCGECSGLTRDILLAGEKKPCSEQGFKSSHKACPQFRPDSTKLAETVENEENLLSELANIMANFNTKQVRLFAAALLNESITRKMGYRFYQRIIIRFRGTEKADYLSNFMSARILTADKKGIRICSDDGKIIFTYDFGEGRFKEEFLSTTLYTPERFKPLQDKMVRLNKRVDPDIARLKARALKAQEIDFELKLNTNGIIDTIENMSKRNKGVGRGKQREIVDLISISRDIERGSVGSHQNSEGSIILKPDRYKQRKGMSEIELSDFEG